MDTTQPPADDDAQLTAKLRGLERMFVAGLITEEAYRAKQAELHGKLRDARGTAPVTPAGTPPPLPPRPEAPAPPPLVTTAPPPPPLVTTAPPPNPSATGEPAATAEAVQPPEPPEPATDEVTRPGTPGMRGVLIATAATLAVLLAGTVTAVLVFRSHSASSSAAEAGGPQPSETPSGTPDPAAALAALRMGSPSLHGVVMDASDADTLVRAYWPVRENALHDRDVLAVRRLESGAAAQWDAVGCTLGCAPPAPRPITSLNVFVPKQATYPAAFMAQVLTTEYHSTSPMVEVMVFTRPSAQQPWSLALDTDYTGVTRPDMFPFPLDGGAFDAPAPRLGVDAAVLPVRLAQYWQHWKNTGTAPAGTTFLDGAFTTRLGQALHETLLEKRANGIAENVTYSADPAADGVWTFAVQQEGSNGAGGYALTCGTVHYSAVNTSTRSGASLLQDQGFSPFGTLLLPGVYSSVTEQGVHQSCFLTAAGSDRVEVIGDNGQATRITGVVAHAAT